ncbi:hypothetical protein Misp02_06420 [Microtetraspora sp. NBRC 16547]|nr:hypothetical protein Misp02_06420 [Microtetraspora sp. NBRC 16547]
MGACLTVPVSMRKSARLISTAEQKDDLTVCGISCEDAALTDANLHAMPLYGDENPTARSTEDVLLSGTGAIVEAEKVPTSPARAVAGARQRDCLPANGRVAT